MIAEFDTHRSSRTAIGWLRGLARKSGHRELGFSSVAAYSYERCSQSGRWVADSRALARKLENLPVLRAALEAAQISWSKAEILVQRATPENEAELLEQAQKTTVRGLRAAFAKKDDVDEDEERFMTLSLSLAKEDEILLEATRILLMEFEKGARGDQWVEALLAEGQTSLIDRVPRGTEVLPDDGGAAHALFVEAMQEAELRRRDAEVRAEKQIERELPHAERDASDVEELSETATVQISGGSQSTTSTAADSSGELMRGGPQHAVRLRLREEIGVWFRALEGSFEQHAGSREEFVRFLCASVWRTWAAALGDLGKWKHVHRRDRYRCASPVCFSHDCTLHHIQYRSDGGGDEESNTITACAECHIHGEHEGRLHVSGHAASPTWVFGRRPILIVEDRVKREMR